MYLRLLMKVASLLSFTILFGVAIHVPAEQPKVLPDLLSASVLIESGNGYGSGVAFKNGNHSFVWTDAHVVQDCQSVKTVVDADTGLPKVWISYSLCWLCQDEIQEGRKVGQVRKMARVIRYNRDEDIALLLVLAKGWPEKGVEFEEPDYVPAEGTPIIHIGSPFGPVGANSLSKGVIAAKGRLRRNGVADEDNPFVYDQASVTANSGSSGGLIATEQGKVIGLVTEPLSAKGGKSLGSICFTPVRRLHEFAKRNKCAFAMDATARFTVSDLLPKTEGQVPLPRDWPKDK